MIIPTDSTTLLRDLGAYAYAADAPAELAEKLQTIPGSAVDKIFTAIEMIYAFHDVIATDGMTILAQLAGFALAHNWDFAGQIGRMQAISDSAMGALGELTLAANFEQPAPVVTYRTDAVDWRDNVVQNLDQLKAGKWAQVKSLREEKENSTAPTPSGVVQIDPASKQKINGLVTMAMVANSQQQPFSVDFTMADNSVVTLDAAAAIAMGIAVGQHVDAIYDNARALRDKINDPAITTAEQLDAIDITAGWPA